VAERDARRPVGQQPSGTTSPDTVISVSHLAKRYGPVTAVVDVSFDVRAGEIFGLRGPNGAGKTTTVEAIQGLRVADGGVIRVLGLDPRTDADRLRPPDRRAAAGVGAAGTHQGVGGSRPLRVRPSLEDVYLDLVGEREA
jgi:ABC-type branched-subunit amino acid transport system ATPase component